MTSLGLGRPKFLLFCFAGRSGAETNIPADEVNCLDPELAEILQHWQEACDRQNGHLSCMSFDGAAVPPSVPVARP